MKASLDLPPGDDAIWRGTHGHAGFGMARASELLAFDHAHEEFHGLDVQHLGDIVAQRTLRAPAGGAVTFALRHANDLLDAGQVRGQGQSSVRRGLATELLFPCGLCGLGGDFLTGHARFELQQGELRVGKLLGLGSILGQEQEADALLQQLVFHLHAPVFQPGFIALTQDTLEHRPEGFGERVEIEGDGHFNCAKSCRNQRNNARGKKRNNQ